MDLQTGLVCAALFVLSAGVLLLISVFGMRSKSYEEALAEQRTLSAGLLGTSRPKSKDKKQKKANKKVKEKSVSSKTASDNFESHSSDSPDTLEDNRKVRSEHQEHKQHVEFEEPIIVITTDEVSAKSVSSNSGGRRSAKRNVRPILVNREPSPVNPSALRDFSNDSPIVLNHFEQIHPKDECELLKSHSKEDLRENAQKNNKKKGKNFASETDVRENKIGKVKIPAYVKPSEDNVPDKFENKKSIDSSKKPEVINNKKQESSKRIENKTKKSESEPLIKNESNKKVTATSAKNQDVNKVLVTEINEERKKIANGVKNIPAVKTIDSKNVSSKNGEIPKPVATLPAVNAKNVTVKMNDTPKNNSVGKISKNSTIKNNENPKITLNKNEHNKNSVKNGELKSLENKNGDFSKNANHLKNGEVLKPSNNTKKNDETLKNVSNKNCDVAKTQANGKNGDLKHSTPTKIKQSIEFQSSLENGIATVQQVAEQHYNAPPLSVQNNNSKKKKRSELSQLQQMSANEGVNVSLLVPLVRKAELSRSEVQILIDLLLNKQHEGPVIAAEWSESRSDPVQKLKKQLAERERILKAEQEAHAGVAQRLREVRGELNARLQALKQAEEAAAQAQAEKQAFAARVQHAQEHIQAEKQHLQQQLQQLQAKISAERMTNKQFQEEHGALQAQRQQLEVAVAHLQENEAALKGQIQAMHNEQQEQQNMVAALSIELRAARTEADMLRENVAHLQSSSDQIQDLVRQLDESRRVCNDLEQRFTSSQRVSQATNDELRKSDEARAQAQVEIQRLKVELAAAQTQAKTKQEDSEKLIAQVKAELSTVQASASGAAEGDKVEILNLQNEISSLRAELQSNKEELETHRTKNNELRKKNWKAMEAFNDAEKLLEKKSLNVHESINRVRIDEQNSNRNFLQRLFPDIKVSHSNNLPYDEYLSEFETAVHSYREIKEMETKSATELALKESKAATEQMIEEAVKAATEAERNKKLERQHSEESYSVINERLKAENSSLNEKLTLATGDIQKLQEQTTRYKTIIDDTEGMLNKLQLHIESEEGNWRRQLENKNAEIASLKMHLSEIQTNEISELKEKLSDEEKRNQVLSTECEALRVQILSIDSSSSMSDIEKLNNEKSRLAEELSHERARCRELSQEVAELQQIQSQIQQLKTQPENHTLTSNGSEAVDSAAVSEDTK